MDVVDAFIGEAFGQFFFETLPCGKLRLPAHQQAAGYQPPSESGRTDQCRSLHIQL